MSNVWNSRVIFSDASKFNLFGEDGKRNTHRRKNERYNEKCNRPTVKHSQYIMIWGCITAYEVGTLEIVEGAMNAEKYRWTTINSVLPAIEDLTQFVRGPVFQDDSAPCPRARSVSFLNFISKFKFKAILKILFLFCR